MNLPEAYLDRMKGQLGEDFDAYLAAMASPEKRAARSNRLKLSPEKLAELRPDFLPTGGEGFLLPAEFAPGRDPLHAAGAYYVQELSAQMAGAYYVQELSAQMPASLFDLTPGMAVLDVCAAPGGKSAQLAAKVPQGVLFSNEIVPNRANVLLGNLEREIVPNRANVLLGNLERMGARNAVVTSMDPEKLTALTGPIFDAVLVDAPCAGEGMFRKDPGAVAEWSPEHVLSCARRQRAILASAQKAVKPGGQLVYSTCSFHLLLLPRGERGERGLVPVGISGLRAHGGAAAVPPHLPGRGPVRRQAPPQGRGPGHRVSCPQKQQSAPGGGVHR